MTTGITLDHIRKSYGAHEVLRGVTATFAPGAIHGLLGANGVGKTTLLSVIANHTFPSGGTVRVDGADPAENPEVLQRLCFVREDQRYPDAFTVNHVLGVAPAFYRTWDSALADHLVNRFRLPLTTKCKKLSRGQRSALAITVALACGAEYTFLDEPYLGLDATARGSFYDELLTVFAATGRTFVVSTHLIDEVADILDDVVVLDDGLVRLAAATSDLAGAAFTARGSLAAVHQIVAGREVIHERATATLATTTVSGVLTTEDRRLAADLGVVVEVASLQDLVAAIGANTPAGASR